MEPSVPLEQESFESDSLNACGMSEPLLDVGVFTCWWGSYRAHQFHIAWHLRPSFRHCVNRKRILMKEKKKKKKTSTPCCLRRSIETALPHTYRFGVKYCKRLICLPQEVSMVWWQGVQSCEIIRKKKKKKEKKFVVRECVDQVVTPSLTAPQCHSVLHNNLPSSWHLTNRGNIPFPIWYATCYIMVAEPHCPGLSVPFSFSPFPRHMQNVRHPKALLVGQPSAKTPPLSLSENILSTWSDVPS